MKQRNPNWDVLAEWAYFKAPTTRIHEFSPHNYNWTAGELYKGVVPALTVIVRSEMMKHTHLLMSY